MSIIVYLGIKRQADLPFPWNAANVNVRCPLLDYALSVSHDCRQDMLSARESLRGISARLKIKSIKLRESYKKRNAITLLHFKINIIISCFLKIAYNYEKNIKKADNGLSQKW